MKREKVIRHVRQEVAGISLQIEKIQVAEDLQPVSAMKILPDLTSEGIPLPQLNPHMGRNAIGTGQHAKTMMTEDRTGVRQNSTQIKTGRSTGKVLADLQPPGVMKKESLLPKDLHTGPGPDTHAEKPARTGKVRDLLQIAGLQGQKTQKEHILLVNVQIQRIFSQKS